MSVWLNDTVKNVILSFILKEIKQQNDENSSIMIGLLNDHHHKRSLLENGCLTGLKMQLKTCLCSSFYIQRFKKWTDKNYSIVIRLSNDHFAVTSMQHLTASLYWIKGRGYEIWTAFLLLRTNWQWSSLLQL